MAAAYDPMEILTGDGRSNITAVIDLSAKLGG